MNRIISLRKPNAVREHAGRKSARTSVVPRHIGFIPDGNRRWAQDRGLPKEHGYAHGIAPGLQLFEACRARGVKEVSVYGFTQDNTRRPTAQKDAFRDACVEFALRRMGVHRIRCAAATDNYPSLRVISRLGFRFEGIARQAEFVGSRWLDHAVFARLATDE